MFGFVSDPDLPPWINTSSYLEKMPAIKYFNRTATENYHNLCTYLNPPVNCGELLGLGLKFCVQNRRPNLLSLQLGVERFTRDVRLKFFFAGKNDSDNSHTDDFRQKRKLYIKSKWPPPVGSKKVEERIKQFGDL